MTDNECRKIAEACADKLEGVPDGFEMTTAMLVKECGFDLYEMDFGDLIEVHMALFKTAKARKLKLDMSKHDGKVEGLPYNLDFAVYHRKKSRNQGI